MQLEKVQDYRSAGSGAGSCCCSRKGHAVRSVLFIVIVTLARTGCWRVFFVVVSQRELCVVDPLAHGRCGSFAGAVAAADGAPTTSSSFRESVAAAAAAVASRGGELGEASRPTAAVVPAWLPVAIVPLRKACMISAICASNSAAGALRPSCFEMMFGSSWPSASPTYTWTMLSMRKSLMSLWTNTCGLRQLW